MQPVFEGFADGPFERLLDFRRTCAEFARNRRRSVGRGVHRKWSAELDDETATPFRPGAGATAIRLPLPGSFCDGGAPRARLYNHCGRTPAGGRLRARATGRVDSITWPSRRNSLMWPACERRASKEQHPSPSHPQTVNLTTGILEGGRRAQPAAIADLPRLSHFVARALDREAGSDRSTEQRLALLRELSERPWTAERMQAELAADLPADAGGEQLATALRRLRRRVLLGLIARDVTGVAGLAEVMGPRRRWPNWRSHRRCRCMRASWRARMACRSAPTMCRRTCWSSAWASWVAANSTSLPISTSCSSTTGTGRRVPPTASPKSGGRSPTRNSSRDSVAA